MESGAPRVGGGDDRHVVQLYEVARTAHLERIVGVERVTLLYREKRYDFDENVARSVRIERAGLLRTVWYAATHPVDLVEVNEPLVTRAALRSLLFIATARLRSLFTGSPKTVAVAYAIANVPTTTLRAHLPWKARLKFEMQRPLARVVGRSLDRIAFGTSDAEAVYRAEFGGVPARASRLIDALPVAVELPDGGAVARPPVVLFLGDLSARKGFPDVEEAWTRLREEVSDAQLVIVGRGEGVDRARTLAEADPRVELHVAPGRDVIRQQLERAKVVVLPSRRRPLWREQVGLPLVEGLAHGCVIVSTDETGIADWLDRNGHRVVPEPEVSASLASAMVDAVLLDVVPQDIQRALPDRDGRDAAREWLYGTGV